MSKPEVELQQDRNIANANIANNYFIEVHRSILELGQKAINSALLINGGASVAILALIGNVIRQESGLIIVAPMGYCVWIFAKGVLSAALGFGAMYVSQTSYELDHEILGKFFHVAAAICAITSYYYFGDGSYYAYQAFLLLKQ